MAVGAMYSDVKRSFGEMAENTVFCIEVLNMVAVSIIATLVIKHTSKKNLRRAAMFY